MRRLHLAVHLPLSKRCHEDFDAMAPAPGGRACERCQHVVRDLSAMTRDEASRFVAEHRGQGNCYRYLARPDGTIVFAAGRGGAGLPAVVALTLAACTPHAPPRALTVEAVDSAPLAPVAATAGVIIPSASPSPARAVEPGDPRPPAPMRPPKRTTPAHEIYLGLEG